MRPISFLPAGLLVLGGLLISGIREQEIAQPVRPMETIGAQFLGVDGRRDTVATAERKVAGMSHYVMRTYIEDDSIPKFAIYVGYYDHQVQGKTIHSPKNCLPGAGWEIMESKKVALPGGPEGARVNRVLLANGGTRAMVYYWYQGRGRVEASEYVVKWNLLRDAAMYGRTEEALVRIVVPVIPRDGSRDDLPRAIAEAEETAQKVAGDLYKQVEQTLPTLRTS